MKANVLVRRIRAYKRRVEELSGWLGILGGDQKRQALREATKAEHAAYLARLSAAEGKLQGFLQGRTRGPWATFSMEGH